MNLEGGKISGSQLIFLMIGFIFGLSTILVPTQPAKQLSWLAILVSGLEALIFFAVYTTLALRFPGKTLIEFNDIIYGPYIGKIISLGYLWYFLHVASLNLKIISDFFTTIFLPETPLTVLMILLTLVCASAVRNGIEVIARCSIPLSIITIFLYIFDTLMLLKDTDFTKLLPFGDVRWQDFLKAVNNGATVSFGATIAFLMVFAFLNKPKETKKASFAIIITSLFLAMATARNTALLGNIVSIATYPSLIAIRQINIGEFLTRMEITAAIIFIATIFVRISVLYYAVVLGTAQLLRLRSYLPLVLPVGVIIIILGLLNFENTLEDFYFAANYYPFYSLPFQVGIPLLSLLVAVIRGVPKKAKG